MAIVEAAACGLLVVSTNVGGVPEVLPEHMRLLAEPVPSDLVKAVHAAVERISRAPVDRQRQHDSVRTCQKTDTTHCDPTRPVHGAVYYYEGTPSQLAQQESNTNRV